jgi:bis(5'-nucleosyl)-tetraphosphatase (symmetrical)
MSDNMKTIIIGDLHGCLDEFKDILYLADHKSPNIKIILLGDILDRGPNSLECIKLARELKLKSVMGNHERKFLNWIENTGGKRSPPKYPHYDQFSKEDIEYMRAMPAYIKIPEHNTVVVHAGVRACVPIEQQLKNDLYHIRYLDSQGKFVSLRTINKIGKEAADAHYWTEFGSFGYNLVYGHQVNSMTDVRIDRFDDGTFCVGIDCGCCFGGKLTAYMLETQEIIQVQAKKEYYKSNFNVR